jgi:hypothetical protein
VAIDTCGYGFFAFLLTGIRGGGYWHLRIWLFFHFYLSGEAVADPCGYGSCLHFYLSEEAAIDTCGYGFFSFLLIRGGRYRHLRIWILFAFLLIRGGGYRHLRIWFFFHFYLSGEAVIDTCGYGFFSFLLIRGARPADMGFVWIFTYPWRPL